MAWFCCKHLNIIINMLVLVWTCWLWYFPSQCMVAPGIVGGGGGRGSLPWLVQFLNKFIALHQYITAHHLSFPLPSDAPNHFRGNQQFTLPLYHLHFHRVISTSAWVRKCVGRGEKDSRQNNQSASPRKRCSRTQRLHLWNAWLHQLNLTKNSTDCKWLKWSVCQYISRHHTCVIFQQKNA